jgi:hypothetical protein
LNQKNFPKFQEQKKGILKKKRNKKPMFVINNNNDNSNLNIEIPDLYDIPKYLIFKIK